ncbi:MAG: glycosyltransferase family 4 protein [Bacteroidota bacterium]|nr:glycosyltransferase family 4 protein [Bacteroidota bacterium]
MAIKALMIEHFGGENPYSYCLCNSLAKLDIDLTLITTSSFSKYNLCEFKTLLYYPAFEKGKIKKILKYIYALAKTFLTIRKGKYDVIHFQTFRKLNIEWLLFIVISYLYKNTIITVHNVLPHEETFYCRLICKWIYIYARKIIVHNGFVYDTLQALLNMHFKKEKICKIPHGNYDYYNKYTDYINISIAYTPKTNSTPLLKMMMFGVMREYKGLDILLKAFSKIEQENVELLICGRAKIDYCRKHEALAKELNINSKVTFDWREIPEDQLVQIVSQADILLYPYRKIYQSGALMLAYTLGKPVIVSMAEGFREDVTDKVNGYITDFTNVEEFSALVSYIISHKVDLEEIGKHNKELSYSKYCWNEVALKTFDLYKQLKRS